jgi:cytochrome bd-type quinol oxidase subunit 2
MHHRWLDLGYFLAYQHWRRRFAIAAASGYLLGCRGVGRLFRLSGAENHFCREYGRKRQSVRFWGIFYGSLGALFCIWGASPSLLSTTGGTIPTDWTYRFFPHTVLVLGMIMVQFGAMVGALALQNRREKPLNMDAEAIRRRDSRARLLFVIAAGLLLVSLHTIASEYLERWMMYQSLFYQVTSGIFLFFLVVVARFVSIEMGSHGHHGRVYASDGLSGLGACSTPNPAWVPS